MNCEIWVYGSLQNLVKICVCKHVFVSTLQSSLPVRPATKAEQMRECLRSLKQNHKDDEAKVKTAFNTLLTYVKNVATNPNEEKFRKIRLTNATFQVRTSVTDIVKVIC
ncbi:hypothetical protein CsSME_00020341 [Camellia sinensis var. sinensis]